MIVHYAEDTEGRLFVSRTDFHFDPRYRDEVIADHPNWVETAEHAPHHELDLDRCPATGAIRVWHSPNESDRRALELVPRLARMPIKAPASLRVGEPATFTAVPPGARILVNGTETDTMDGSECYEIDVDTAGTYVFRFELSAYKPFEVRLEAVA